MFEYLSKQNVEDIHESTLRVLEEVGIKSQSTRFLSACQNLGLRVQEGVVYFPRELVEKAIQSAPSQFTIYGRDESKSVQLGQGNVYAQTCIGTPFIKDIDTGERRSVVYEDLENFIRVCDGLEHIDIISAIFPKDIPEHAAVTVETAAMVRNTTKPLHICIESDHEMRYIPQVLAAAVGGMDNLVKKPIAYLEVSPISPLDYAEGPANGLLDVVECGLPLGIIPCPMIGATGPMTLIGSVTMHNAELLAGLVVAQLLKPGHPVILSPRVTFIDMRTAIGLWAAPEMGLAGTASMQLAKYYGVPSQPTGFSSSAKVSDEQSGFERMFNALMPALAGADILGTAGSLDNALISCYRTLMVDNEVSSLVKRAVKGETVNQDMMAVDVIKDVAHGEGNFLAHDHTIKHLRSEFWNPILCERNNYESWVAKQDTFGDKAIARARDMYENYRHTPLSNVAESRVAQAVEDAITKK